jgi:hypothetical protein
VCERRTKKCGRHEAHGCTIAAPSSSFAQPSHAASISTTRGMHGMPDYGNVLRATDSASLHAAAQ